MKGLDRLVPLLLVSSASAQVCLHDRPRFSVGATDANSGGPQTLVVGAGRAAVGRQGDAAAGLPIAGRVQLLERQGGAWVAAGTIESPDACSGETFGTALALDGDTLAVGTGQGRIIAGAPAPHCMHEGAVYVFDLSGPVPVHEGTLVGGPTSFSFGETLALCGDVLVVGDPKDVAAGQKTGRVYVYRRTAGSWGLEQELFLPAAMADDELGRAVQVRGDTIAVGAPGYAPPIGVGGIFLYRWNGSAWLAEDVLLPSIPGEYLGASVALDEDRLVAVSSTRTRLTCYVRAGSSWLPIDVFEAEPGFPTAINERIRSIELDGTRLLVGCSVNLTDTGYLDVGYAQLWQLHLSRWQRLHEWPPELDEELTGYGSAVALDGPDILIRELKDGPSPVQDKLHPTRIVPCHYAVRHPDR